MTSSLSLLLAWIVLSYYHLANCSQTNVQTEELANEIVFDLDEVCVESDRDNGEWWAYSFCVNRNITQFHPNSRMINAMDTMVSSFYITYDAETPNELRQTFKEGRPDCYTRQGKLIPRSSEAIVKCCSEQSDSSSRPKGDDVKK